MTTGVNYHQLEAEVALLHRGLCVTQTQRAAWGELYCSVRPPVSGLGAEPFIQESWILHTYSHLHRKFFEHVLL